MHAASARGRLGEHHPLCARDEAVGQKGLHPPLASFAVEPEVLLDVAQHGSVTFAPPPLSPCFCSKEIIDALTGHASKSLAPKWAYALVRRSKSKFEKAAPYLSPSPPVAAGASAHVGKSHTPAGHSSPLPWLSPGNALSKAAQADSCYASAAKPAAGSALHNFVGSASANVDIRQVAPLRQQPRAVQSSVLCGKLFPLYGAERHAWRRLSLLVHRKACFARTPKL